MNLETGSSKRYFKKFLLDETKLRKINSVLQKASEKLDEDTETIFHIEREDNTYYKTNTIEDVFKDDNSVGKKINWLDIKVKKTNSEENETSAYVRFSKSYNDRILISVNDKNRDWCLLLKDELDTQIQRVSKKVFLSNIPSGIIELFLLFLAAIFPAISFYINFLNSKPVFVKEQLDQLGAEDKLDLILLLLSRTDNDPIAIWLVASIAIMVMFSFVLLVVWLRPVSRITEKLNRSIFYLGDEIEVYDKFQTQFNKVKWGIIIAFLVSLAATIAGYFITQ